MLYLMYDNVSHTDGAGSQMMRILGIYAIAKAYNCTYIFTPMASIEHCSTEEIKTRWNELCKQLTPDSITQRPSLPIVNITHITEKDIPKYDNVILKVLYPFNIVDRHPGMLYAIQYKTEPLDIVTIHVRRGDAKSHENRMLPDAYYRSLIQSIKKENPKTEFHVYSDELVDLGEDCMYFVNTDPVQSVYELSRGKIFIMSRSGFSVIAARMCAGEVIYPPNFWHSPLPHWKTALDKI